MLPRELNDNTSGIIIERQSSFVRICTGDGVQYKIHYVGKLEFFLDQKSFTGVSISKEHALMKHHQQRTVDIFISSAHDNPSSLAGHFSNMVKSEYDGWRRTGDCFNLPDNIESLLRDGHGLLYRGPEALAKEVAFLLDQSSVKYSIQYGNVRERTELEALKLGGNVVIANEFIFDREMS